MKRSILFLLVVLTLASCGCSKRLPTSSDNSVRVIEHTELIPYTVSLPVPEIKETTRAKVSESHLENEFATSDAIVHPDGTLEHNLATKPQERPVTVEIPYTTRDSVEIRTVTQYKEVPVPTPLTWWQRFRLSAFWWLVLVVALAVLWIFIIPKFIPRI